VACLTVEVAWPTTLPICMESNPLYIGTSRPGVVRDNEHMYNTGEVR
jgi:hypothetical protein